MIGVSEVTHTSLYNAAPGDLVLLFHHDEQGKAALVVRDPERGDKLLYMFDDRSVSLPGDQAALLSLGKPTIRFDRASAIAGDAVPKSGTLMLTDKGPGIYDQRGPVQSRNGYLISFDGEIRGYYRYHTIPTFESWAVGVTRGDEFVPVVAVSMA